MTPLVHQTREISLKKHLTYEDIEMLNVGFLGCSQILSSNLPSGFKCGTYQVTRQYTSISQRCHIVHNMPRYRDVLPIVGSRTFETIVHVYDAKALRIMLVLQALHHLHCKLEVFYPGTLEMLGTFGKTLDHFFNQLCHNLAYPIPRTETLPMLYL